MEPFKTWQEVLAAAKRGEELHYKAPMNTRPTTLRRLVEGDKYSTNVYEPKAKTVKIIPYGARGRGRMRTADPFTADAGHLDRFLRADGSGFESVDEAYRRAQSHVRHGVSTIDEAIAVYGDSRPSLPPGTTKG